MHTVSFSIYYNIFFFEFCALCMYSLNDCECVRALVLAKKEVSWSAWQTNNDVWKNGEIYIIHWLIYVGIIVSEWWTNELSAPASAAAKAASANTLFPYFNWMSHIQIYEKTFFDNDYKFAIFFPSFCAQNAVRTHKIFSGIHMHIIIHTKQ